MTVVLYIETGIKFNKKGASKEKMKDKKTNCSRYHIRIGCHRKKCNNYSEAIFLSTLAKISRIVLGKRRPFLETSSLCTLPAMCCPFVVMLVVMCVWQTCK